VTPPQFTVNLPPRLGVVMCGDYLYPYASGGFGPDAWEEIAMQQSAAREPLRQEVDALEILRSRTRTRRRRRKRSWVASRALPVAVVLIYSTFRIGPSRFTASPAFFKGAMADLSQVFMVLYAVTNVANWQIPECS
jgi:hypothetical protein